MRLVICAAALALLGLTSCANDQQRAQTVRITAEAPRADGPVYLTGNLETLGPWSPDALLMKQEDGIFTADIEVPPGFEFEYKFTLGSWGREALGPSGMVMPNNKLTMPGQTAVHHEIPDFKKPVLNYIEDWQGSGVKGELIYWTDFESDILGPDRHISIWLPENYRENPDQRFDVLYMSDGQNLFDPRIANTGIDWGVDEAMIELIDQGRIDPAIVVAAWSTAERGPEYSPWHEGPLYARFLIEELMPRINAEFQTNIGPRHTFHAGSSMGGLISYYLVTRHPDVFGACGCISTHTILSEAMVQRYFAVEQNSSSPDETPYIIRDLENDLSAPEGVRFWFDYGTEGLDAEYGPQHKALKAWLLSQRLTEGTDFVLRKYDGADHNEASWRARLPDILEFVLKKDAS